MERPRRALLPRVGLQVSDEGVWHTKASMLRTERYKYVRRLYEQDELYDLEHDPGEEQNLADDPAMGEVVAELRMRMLTWYQETADVVPFEGDQRQF